jgi:hypothetical protein
MIVVHIFKAWMIISVNGHIQYKICVTIGYFPVASTKHAFIPQQYKISAVGAEP